MVINTVNLRNPEGLPLEESFTEGGVASAFARGLKRLRNYKNLTYADVSRGTEIIYQTIARYENEINIPTIVQAIKLACFYEISIEGILWVGIGTDEEADDLIEKHYSDLKIIKRNEKKGIYERQTMHERIKDINNPKQHELSDKNVNEHINIDLKDSLVKLETQQKQLAEEISKIKSIIELDDNDTD